MPKIFAIAVLTLALVGCSAKKADTVVAVTGTDKACTAADTTLNAGTIRFQMTNKAKLTNELYVLGDKDRVIKEVENVLPGGTADLDVDLKAGTYTLNCKPGQTGDGFRQKFTVKGAGGTTGAVGAKADRTIDVTAREFAYTFATPLSINQGDAIEFDLTNAGQEHHEFEVLGPDGKSIGEIESVAPGRSGTATFVFAKPGVYTYQCLLKTPDGRVHKNLGMTGTFTVS
ncbi:MAG TPA: cupredoxin domain-containing protein [Acidimicrobiales bacterium]|nr:cupredoxin domain-containing protein [Acidimicrobiales bacterium]